jgi:hypothetical protein
VGIRSTFSKLSKRKREPTLERAEQAYSEGRRSDAAALFRALAETGSAQAQLRLAQLYERGEGENFELSGDHRGGWCLLRSALCGGVCGGVQ